MIAYRFPRAIKRTSNHIAYHYEIYMSAAVAGALRGVRRDGAWRNKSQGEVEAVDEAAPTDLSVRSGRSGRIVQL